MQERMSARRVRAVEANSGRSARWKTKVVENFGASVLVAHACGGDGVRIANLLVDSRRMEEEREERKERKDTIDWLIRLLSHRGV